MKIEIEKQEVKIMYEIFVGGMSVGVEELTFEEAHALDNQEGIVVKKVVKKINK